MKTLVLVLLGLLLAGLGVVRLYDAAVVSDPGVDFGGGEVVADRAAARSGLTAELDRVAARAPALHLVAQGTGDACTDNQHNWKVKQAFAHDCTLEVVRVYTFAGEFRSQARLIGEALRAGDCPAAAPTDTEVTLRAYYDKYVGSKRPDGTLYGPADLPGSYGSCDPRSWSDADGPEVTWLPTPPTPDQLRHRSYDVPMECVVEEACAAEPIDLPAAVRAGRVGDRWVAIVRIERTYHSVAWD